MLLTNPLPLEHFDLVRTVFPGHNVGVFFFQSGFDNGLELFQEAVPPLPKRARVMRTNIGNRVDGELGLSTDVHRIDDETERRDEATRENYPFEC